MNDEVKLLKEKKCNMAESYMNKIAILVWFLIILVFFNFMSIWFFPIFYIVSILSLILNIIIFIIVIVYTVKSIKYNKEIDNASLIEYEKVNMKKVN